jgi:hypothetical protein
MIFLSLTLGEGERSTSCPGRFTPGETALGICRLGGLVGPRAGLDAVDWRKTSCPCRKSNPGRPARSLSLYRAILTLISIDAYAIYGPVFQWRASITSGAGNVSDCIPSDGETETPGLGPRNGQPDASTLMAPESSLRWQSLRPMTLKKVTLSWLVGTHSQILCMEYYWQVTIINTATMTALQNFMLT